MDSLICPSIEPNFRPVAVIALLSSVFSTISVWPFVLFFAAFLNVGPYAVDLSLHLNASNAVDLPLCPRECRFSEHQGNLLKGLFPQTGR